MKIKYNNFVQKEIEIINYIIKIVKKMEENKRFNKNFFTIINKIIIIIVGIIILNPIIITVDITITINKGVKTIYKIIK